MTLYIGIDLGIHLAATAIDDDLVCRWQYYRKRPKGEEPCEAMRHLLYALEEQSDGDPDWPMGLLDLRPTVVLCAERTWLNTGSGYIDPRDLFPLAEQLGYLFAWADTSASYSVQPLDDSAAMARETGINKDRREEAMPTLISGLDWSQFLGPRGGREAIAHLADSAFLAFVAHRHTTWQRKIEEATQ